MTGSRGDLRHGRPRVERCKERAALVTLLLATACADRAGPLVVSDPCWENPARAEPSSDLRCTGLYEDWEAKRVSWNVRAFAPGTPLWSDGARKQRWIYLPPGQVIDAADPDEWVFPVGTRAWKEFSLGGRRIETRMFAKVAPATWQHATYVWSSDGATALRNDVGIGDWQGSGYSVPASGDCDKCHGGRRDRLLGFEAVGLGEPAATGVTLDELGRDGRILPPLYGTAVQLPQALPAEQRAALSWLHVNCGTSCHNRAADARAMGTGLFLRLELGQLAASRGGGGALDPVATTVSVATRAGRWPGPRIAPGSPARSQLFRLASSRGDEQMPPLLSHVPDPEGVRVLGAWIESLAAEPTP